MERRILLVCAIASALAACTKPTPDNPVPEQERNAPQISSLSAESIILYPAEYSLSETVTFTVSDADDVKIEAPTGISAELSQKDGECILMLTATGEFSSPARVNVTARSSVGEASTVIKIEKADFSLNYESYNAPRAGASITVTATTNVGAVLKSIGGSWIKVEPQDGAFIVNIDRNGTFSERTANIVFTDGRGVMERTVSISQEAAIDYATNERKALEALWKATGGENWKTLSNTTGGQTYSTANWCTDAPVSSWYGVTLNGDGHVIYLHLTGVGLKGTLPQELGDLAFLQELWLSGNELSGSLPESLGRLSVLKDIDLSGMSISGNLEDCSLKRIASHLKNLSLSGNMFTGGFPEWVADMPENANFWMQGNCLSGKVPERVKSHPRWNAEVMDGTGRTVGQINMEQQEGYVLE